MRFKVFENLTEKYKTGKIKYILVLEGEDIYKPFKLWLGSFGTMKELTNCVEELLNNALNSSVKQIEVEARFKIKKPTMRFKVFENLTEKYKTGKIKYILVLEGEDIYKPFKLWLGSFGTMKELTNCVEELLNNALNSSVKQIEVEARFK